MASVAKFVIFVMATLLITDILLVCATYLLQASPLAPIVLAFAIGSAVAAMANIISVLIQVELALMVGKPYLAARRTGVFLYVSLLSNGASFITLGLAMSSLSAGASVMVIAFVCLAIGLGLYEYREGIKLLRQLEQQYKDD